jgi:enoyl-CoA hydratase
MNCGAGKTKIGKPRVPRLRRRTKKTAPRAASATAKEIEMSDCFSVSTEGGISHIVLNAPQRMNAMTRDFWIELPRIMRELDAAGGTRVAVISSTGKHFSAGMDLSVFSSNDALDTNTVMSRERFRQQLRELQHTFDAIAQARFPVIAAVQGGCIGGAVDLVTACCLRYCTADAYFVIQEIHLGMMADVGTMQRAPKLLPDAIVRELAYTGDKLSAARAERIGFVNGVFENAEELHAHALSAAAKIAAKAPLAVASSKEMISYARDHSVAESTAYLNALQPGIFSIEDILNSVKAQKAGAAAKFDDLPALNPGIRTR